MDSQVLEELATLGKYLVEQNPEATFADLLIAYFKYKTGSDYSGLLEDPPDDVKVIQLHILGSTPDQIAEVLQDDTDYIRWVLIMHGFSPFSNSELRSWKMRDKREREQAKFERLVRDGVFS